MRERELGIRAVPVAAPAKTAKAEKPAAKKTAEAKAEEA